MNRMKIWLLGFLLFWGKAAFSQNSTPGYEATDITPISPNAAALGKFGQIPVSLYTGVPAVSVPLFELNVNGYKFPLSLDYHAGGIKVDDLASSVGLGWALSAGGVINREQRGIPDEIMVDYYLQHEGEVSDMNDMINESNHSLIANNWFSNTYDTEPDIFSFNVGGESCKFFYEPNGEVHMMPAEKRFKIVHKNKYFLDGAISYAWAKWEITDDNGVTYVFGYPEESCIDAIMNPCDQNKNVNTWHLTSIILPNKSVITFTYDEESFSESQYVYLQRFLLVPDPEAPCQPNNNGSTIITNYKMLRLANISFPGGEIDFVAGSSRTDIPEAKYIDRMEVYTYQPTPRKLVKAYKFNYNNASRLLLESLAEINIQTLEQEQKYQFTYDTRILSVPRFSYAQDLWGYWNGQTTNTELIPGIINRNTNGMIVTAVPGANRAVDEEYTQAGILKKVTYPTGGYAAFEYENNKALCDENTNAAIRAAANWYQPYPIVEKSENFSSENISQGLITSYSDPFEITNAVTGRRDFEVVFTAHYLAYSGPACPPQYYPPPASAGAHYFNCATVSLEAVGSGQTRSISNVIFGIPYLFTQEGPWNSIWEQPGTYRFKIQWNANMNGMFYVSAKIQTDFISPQLDVSKGEMFAGGLRVKKITSAASATTPAYVKIFDYDLSSEDDPSLEGITSGVPMNIPVNYEQRLICYECESESGALVGSIGIVTATPASALLSTDKINVGYKKVTLYTDEVGGNGKTESYFTTAVEYPDDDLLESLTWPYPRARAIDWRRGLPTVQKEYDEQGNILIKSTNTYSFEEEDNSEDFMAIKVFPYQFYLQDFNGGRCQTVGEHTHYRIASDFFHKSTVSEKIYVNGSVSSFLQTEQHLVQDFNSLAINKIEKDASKDEKTITYVKYPMDYDLYNLEQPLSSAAKGLNYLVSRNFLTRPVETIIVKKDENGNEFVVSGSVIIYHADKPLPKTVYRFEPATPVPLNSFQYASFDQDGDFVMYPGYLEKLSIARYDAAQNILEQKPFNGGNEVFLWGYDQQYPVAKIVNSDYATVRSIIEPTILLNPSNDEELRTEVNKIRTAFAGTNVQVTTYTYAPQIGVTSETDMNGRTTYYEYDGLGRLMVIRDNDKKVVKKLCYNYNGITEQCAVTYYNAKRSMAITPACSPGLTGIPVIYTVEPGTFTSIVSQEDADQQAIDDITANGQAYANQHGSCTSSPTVYHNLLHKIMIASQACEDGEAGIPFYYTIPANKYNSLISQEDADQQALDEIRLLSQDYADQNGQCSGLVPVILAGINPSSNNKYISIINEFDEVVDERAFPVNNAAGIDVILIPPGEYRFTFYAPKTLSGSYNNFMFSILPDDYQWMLSDGYSSNSFRYVDTDFISINFGSYYTINAMFF